MTKMIDMGYRNDHYPVELGDYGALSKKFRWVIPCDRQIAPYMVYADTLKYRMDGRPDPLDVGKLFVEFP